jgi:acetyl-CoA carboxylase biotin carboxyl carrier protein
MNIKNVKSLVQIMEASGLTAIEVSEGDTRIRLERAAGGPASAAAPVQAAPAEVLAPAEEGVVDFNNVFEVKSPMVGIFYTAPKPGAEPFVKIGDRVKKGDVLCIIEAMKLMNEITAETDGEIVDICAVEGQIVEFSQVLFKIF